MQLTLFTDYALRTLMYLASHPGQVVPSSQIGEAFGASSDTLTKATKWLTQQGYVDAQRGKTGGLTLRRQPESIKIGQLVFEAEPHMNLLECFQDATSSCPLTPACKLKRALFQARAAFIGALDDYTLADLVSNRAQLVQLLATRG